VLCSYFPLDCSNLCFRAGRFGMSGRHPKLVKLLPKVSISTIKRNIIPWFVVNPFIDYSMFCSLLLQRKERRSVITIHWKSRMFWTVTVFSPSRNPRYFNPPRRKWRLFENRVRKWYWTWEKTNSIIERLHNTMFHMVRFQGLTAESMRVIVFWNV
jgi:hypothetical protein